MAVVETQPLLGSPAGGGPTTYGHPSASAARPPRVPRRTFLSRLFPIRKGFAHQTDRTHLATTHALLPVDVISVHADESAAGDLDGNVEDKNARRDVNETDYLKSKLWWLGFILMNVGELGNFISYAFAPASVVAPLGTFALIANCMFAPLMLGERFRKRDFFGVVIAILGAITVVLSTNPSDVRLDPTGLIHAISQRVFVIYAVVYIAGALVLSGLSERSTGARWVFVDVGLCALFGGFTVLSTKAFSTLLTLRWFEIFTEWITYPVIAVLLGTGIGQIRYLNRALMRFDSKLVVPTQFVLFNLSAIVGSAILYGDFKQATFHQLVTFLYGCAATFAGVFIIAWAPLPDEEETAVSYRDDGSRVEEGVANHNVHLGSLARRNRASLILPEGASASATPVLRNRSSLVSMYGFSPAQRVLLINSSPRDEFVRPLLHDERDVVSTPDSFRRRRAISWLSDDAYAHHGVRRYGPVSDHGTRENSRSHFMQKLKGCVMSELSFLSRKRMRYDFVAVENVGCLA
ncbi:putative magnesium transporter NIPA1 [Grifola frondosa]|uniref:Putative magnesium transporter NIPA1 n=1 Tax=Grifola frondosa TaxID=5627 RepID=A0A1C7MGW8_GRIFR|nr:putative magnesium transporter NIPA1 [Grifola frondosa]